MREKFIEKISIDILDSTVGLFQLLLDTRMINSIPNGILIMKSGNIKIDGAVINSEGYRVRANEEHLYEIGDKNPVLIKTVPIVKRGGAGYQLR